MRQDIGRAERSAHQACGLASGQIASNQSMKGPCPRGRGIGFTCVEDAESA
jgi:hypothetical protein